MRVLAFNHFFDQDLDALLARLRPEDDLVALPYQRLFRLARRHFPEAAFIGVEPAMSGKYATEWRRYEEAVARVAEWLTAAYAPNVFVVPTDAIFYLRPLIAGLDALGVPTVVVQKETTISPMVMDEHAANVKRTVPFMSDHMTVCSERQREFWLRAGTAPEQITVTGQPRFDVYATPRPRRSGSPRLLYLSYDDNAYLPSDTGLSYDGSWRELRLETERALDAFSSTWTIIAKEHPQQASGDTALGGRVVRAPRDADTRQLILEADAVVGFQTTALFEAAAAGRPVVYAAWGDVYERALPMLIPFHHYGFVRHVSSADELASVLEDPRNVGDGQVATVDPTVVEHIGVVDGGASERALDVVRAHSRPAPEPTTIAPGLAARAALATAGAPLARVAAAASRTRVRRLTGPLERRAGHWGQEAAELKTIVRRRVKARTRCR